MGHPEPGHHMAAGEHLEGEEYNSRKIRWSMEELAASKVEKFELCKCCRSG